MFSTILSLKDERAAFLKRGHLLAGQSGLKCSLDTGDDQCSDELP